MTMKKKKMTTTESEKDEQFPEWVKDRNLQCEEAKLQVVLKQNTSTQKYIAAKVQRVEEKEISKATKEKDKLPRKENQTTSRLFQSSDGKQGDTGIIFSKPWGKKSIYDFIAG